MTYLAGLIVEVWYVCVYECRPPPFWLAVYGPLRPIGADAGPGEVESGKPGNPPGSPLHYRGRGEGGRSRIFLSPWITYDHPSRFTCPQELPRNTVKLQLLRLSLLILMAEWTCWCLFFTHQSRAHVSSVNKSFAHHQSCAPTSLVNTQHVILKRYC